MASFDGLRPTLPSAVWLQLGGIRLGNLDFAPVDRALESRTVLTAAGTPAFYNAALISPYIVNVIPQQFTVR